MLSAHGVLMAILRPLGRQGSTLAIGNSLTHVVDVTNKGPPACHLEGAAARDGTPDRRVARRITPPSSADQGRKVTVQHKTVIKSGSRRPAWHRAGRHLLVALALAAVGGGLVAIGLDSTSQAAMPTIACAPRLIVTDMSSAGRSSKLSALAQQVIEESADSAVVCEDSFAAYAVSGGGEVSTIVTSDDLSGYTAVGPNAQIRSERFAAPQRQGLASLITHRLAAAYRGGNAAVTSIPALYSVASQHSTVSTDVVFITTGVNDDEQVNLNRPLAVGQGFAFARGVSVPHVSAQVVTVVGVAQVDATTPPPSPVWPEEIGSFNQALCRASGATRCRLFDLASVTEVLST